MSFDLEGFRVLNGLLGRVRKPNQKCALSEGKELFEIPSCSNLIAKVNTGKG